MRALIHTVAWLAACLALFGCGSAGHSSSASSGTSEQHAGTGPSARGPGKPEGSATQQSLGTGAPAAGANGAPAAGGNGTAAAGGPTASVRLPATFKIRPGGSLEPGTVSSPSSVTIQLTVISLDSRAHRVSLRAPGGRPLTVPARGRASVALKGLKNGSYKLEVDGASRGSLMVGVLPGP